MKQVPKRQGGRAILAFVLSVSVSLCAGIMAQTTRRNLTNADVIKMVSAGLGMETIVLSIENSDASFDTSADALVSLKQAAVPEPVIAAMLKAARPASVASRPDTKPADRTGSNSDANASGNADSPALIRTFLVHGNHKAGRMWDGVLTLRPGRIEWQAEGNSNSFAVSFDDVVKIETHSTWPNDGIVNVKLKDGRNFRFSGKRTATTRTAEGVGYKDLAEYINDARSVKTFEKIPLTQNNR